MPRIDFIQKELRECFNFASRMRGNHNPNMIMARTDQEIFRDDFRGKLGEVAVKKYLESNVYTARIDSEIDFNVTPRGQWDLTDMIVNSEFINVKSIKQNSNFLLVETLRYDADGNYNYLNNDGTPVRVDYYVLVRVTVDPDVQNNIFNQTFERFLSDGFKNGKSVPREIFAEILGGISHQDFWRLKGYAPAGIRCDLQNLNYIANGGVSNNLPSSVRNTDGRNNILQQNNYVIGVNNLTPLDILFK